MFNESAISNRYGNCYKESEKNNKNMSLELLFYNGWNSLILKQ